MDLAGKLQLKGQSVQVLALPPGLRLGVPTVDDRGSALLVFATTKAGLRPHERIVVESARMDRLTWVAYPKAGQLGTDLNRDILWRHFAPQGIRPVRNVALDGVWSALRFRPG